MSTVPQEPSEIRFFDAIRLAYLEAWTGRLGLDSADIRGQLFFVGGELYLSPEHPFESKATGWTNAMREIQRQAKGQEAEAEDRGQASGGGPNSQASAEAHMATKRLLVELADLLFPCAGEACHFVDGAGQIRLDLIGPLPTGRLVMETSVLGKDEGALLHRLGGEESSLAAAPVESTKPTELELDPQEAFLLSRLENPLTVGEMLQQLNVERVEILQSLCRLLSVGLIRGEAGPIGRPESRSFGTELVHLLAERIADSLEKEPVTLSTDEHRELLGNLLGRMGDMTFFELLAVGPQSEVEEVHRAFMELGRMVHPMHADRLSLARGERALQLLLERATEAYFTLSDSERRAEYFEQVGPLQISGLDSASEEEREEEMKSVARRNFQLAKGMVDRQEFHAAIQLLEQAVRSDPQSEYLALLAECQAYNPRWFERALQNMSRAVGLRPGDGALRLRYGSLLERKGDLARAREEYQAALERGPEVIAAQESLNRLGSVPAPRTQAKSLSKVLRSFFGKSSSG